MARSFAGSAPDKIVYSRLAALDGASRVAVSLWIYPATSGKLMFDSPLHQVGAPGSGSGSNSGFCVYHNGTDPTTIYVECRNGDGSTNYWNGVLTADTWNHLYILYDGTRSTATDRVQVYVAGQRRTRSGGSGTNPTTLGTNNQPFVLGGATSNGSTNPWTGRLADVAMWTDTLPTESECAMMAAGIPSSQIKVSTQVFRDLLADGVAPTNAITSAAGTVTGTTSVSEPSTLRQPPTALAANVWTHASRTLATGALMSPVRTFDAGSSQYLEAVTGLGLGANDPFYVVTWGRRDVSGPIVTFTSVGVGATSANRRDLFAYDGSSVQAASIDSDGSNAGADLPTAFLNDSNYHAIIGEWASASSRRLIVDGVRASDTTTRTLSAAPTHIRVGARLFWNDRLMTGPIPYVAIFAGTASDELIALHRCGVLPTDLPGDLLDCWYLNATGNITGVNGTVLTAVNGGSLIEGPLTTFAAKPRGIATDVWGYSTRTLSAVTALNLQRMSQMNFALPFIRTGVVPGA